MLHYHIFKVYKPWRGRNFSDEAKSILAAWLATVCMTLFLVFAFKVGHKFSRGALFYWFVVTPGLHVLCHAVLRSILQSLRAKGWNTRSCVIAGTNGSALAVAEYIRSIPQAGVRVLGFFGESSQKEVRLGDGTTKPVLGTIKDLPDYLRTHKVDFLYITLPLAEEQTIQKILLECRTLGCRIYYVPDFETLRALNSRIERFGDLVLLNFNPDRTGKRLFDVIFSFLALLVTSPLFLLIACAIKLHDGGPVFFIHRRVTAAGKPFGYIKFRTMYMDAGRRLAEILENDPSARAEWEQRYKLTNDPRITPIGKLLRRTSLDELPQFLNVLKGDMSVVGARPVVEEELMRFYQNNGGIYCSVKPGITGPWQVSKRSDDDYESRVALDTWYAMNQNTFLDIKIICKTIGCMLMAHNE